jgi:hypothetical protein
LACWDRCFALPQLLYRWRHQSVIFWIPPRIAPRILNFLQDAGECLNSHTAVLMPRKRPVRRVAGVESLKRKVSYPRPSPALTERRPNFVVARVLEICAVLEYYAACSGNSLPTFRDKLSIPFSRHLKKSEFPWISLNPLQMGLIGYPKTSAMNYHYTLCNIPEERRSHLLSDGNLKSRPCLSLGTETFGQTRRRKDVYVKEVS